MTAEPHALTGAAVAVVADALDALGLRDQVLAPALGPLAPGMRAVGRALPVRIEATAHVPDNPYDLQMRVLEVAQDGDVLVIAAGECGTRAAMWGELFSCAALGRGVAGVVTDGLVRDVRQTRELGFAVFARGASPLDTLGRADVAALAEPVICGGVRVAPGDAVVADDDGIVIVPLEVLPEVVARVTEKARLEGISRGDLLAGMPIREVWERHGVL